MRDDEPRSRIDSLIDDVARSMTSGLPGNGLKVRVASRVSGRAARRLTLWRPALAIAVLIVAAIVSWIVDPEPRAPSPEYPASPFGFGAAGPSLESRDSARPSAQSGTAVLALEQEVSPDSSPGEMEPVAIEPVVLERIEPAGVTLEVLSAPAPLGIEQLTVEPLSVASIE